MTAQKKSKTIVKEIPVSAVKDTLCRMRLERDYEKEELLESIRQYGILNPVKVRAHGKSFVLFAGHRRLDCAKELKHATIPAEIWEDIPEKEVVLMGLVDNINRKDFTLLEEAYAYRKLVKEYGWKVDELVKPCGKHRSRIYALLHLVDSLPEKMEQAIIDGKISTGAALALLRFPESGERNRLFGLVVNDTLKVRDLEYLLARRKPDSEKSERELLLDIVEDEYEHDTTVGGLWGNSITLRRSRRGDKLTIEFSGPADLLHKFEILSAPLRKAKPRFKNALPATPKRPLQAC